MKDKNSSLYALIEGRLRDVENLILTYFPDLTNWREAFTYDVLYAMWSVSGVILFLVWAVWSYNLMRRIMGHVKFRGTWYSGKQLEAFIKMLDEDCSTGRRVMQYDEMSLLRQWKYGDTKTYGVKMKGFVR